MAARPNTSKQTRYVLAALVDSAADWHYGYDLSRRTDLKSGTLYPILIRLEAQGWLEARWADEATPGKPRRHLYRLTAAGREGAQAILTAPESPPARADTMPARERGAS